MRPPRIIPVLLLSDGGLVKTVNFKNPKYVGDPINAVRIFNEKEVDELVLLDIKTSADSREPNYSHIEEIVSEAFMPIGYGGGINCLNQIEKLYKIGIEKVIINSAFFSNPNLITEAVSVFGSQSIVVSIDVKNQLWGDYKIYSSSGTKKYKYGLIDTLRKVQSLGAGEILLNSIEKDGTMTGFDIELIQTATKEIDIPLIAVGGAGCIDDFKEAIDAGASAVAAGSMFIYQGIHRAVLISYVQNDEVKRIFSKHYNKKL